MGAEGEDPKQKRGETAAVGTNPQRISEEQFLSWKRQKDAATSARKTESARKREEDIASGVLPMNGRELFLHEPWVFDNSSY